MNWQSEVKAKYQRSGWTVLNVMKLSDNGYPDLLCMKQGEVDIWIECKEGKDTLKPLQEYRIKELRKLGKSAFCWHREKGVIF